MPCSCSKSPPIPSHAGTAKTGLSRREVADSSPVAPPLSAPRPRRRHRRNTMPARPHVWPRERGVLCQQGALSARLMAPSAGTIRAAPARRRSSISMSVDQAELRRAKADILVEAACRRIVGSHTAVHEDRPALAERGDDPRTRSHAIPRANHCRCGSVTGTHQSPEGLHSQACAQTSASPAALTVTASQSLHHA
jgi:hypothetical protein